MRVAISVVATIAAGGVATALLLALWLDDNPDSESVLQIGQSVTEGDLTITLVEAQFSETRSLLTFDTRIGSVAERGDFPSVLLSERRVDVTGVEPNRRLEVSYQRPALDAVRYYVEAGPPIHQNQPVTVTIHSVETYVGGQFTIVEGPWNFVVQVN